MTNLYNNLADICGMVPETATPPRPRPRTPGTRAEQEAAWYALARAMGWPLHRAEVAPFTGVDPISSASAWYAMTGPMHRLGDA